MIRLAFLPALCLIVAGAQNAKAGIYSQSQPLNVAGPAVLEVAGSAASGDLRLLAPGAPPRGLVALHTLAPGAAIACVSAPSDAVGPTLGVNLGVHVKSVAVLMDAGWREIDTSGVLAGGTFENWENCGEKPEGRPSPMSKLMPGPEGGLVEDVFDGNPGTNLNVIRRVWSRDAVLAMLGDGLAVAELTLHLTAFAHGADRLLVLRGDPYGFIAAYVPVGG